MSGASNSEIFAVRNRFLRSTDIERDWNDPHALADFVITDHAKETLLRISAGLRVQSSMRAWRLTGDYGSGKSTFALLLAHAFSSKIAKLPAAIKATLKSTAPELFKKAALSLFPILITGNREPLGGAILRNLLVALELDGQNSELAREIETILSTPDAASDKLVIKYLGCMMRFLVETNKANGLLLILDEAGKFLEHASIQREQHDIFLLQSLAEMAARSGGSPLVVVTLFHQGISTYAANLPRSQQKEWEKISGRFDEITWHHPLEQIGYLAANALNSNQDILPQKWVRNANKQVTVAVNLGWYGADANRAIVYELAKKLYPLHPTVLPVLVRLFSDFGQNERSLFSFLLGSEPFGLQEFIAREPVGKFYRLSNLYDYALNTFGSRLAQGGRSYHWNIVLEVVRGFSSADKEELEILKIVGLLTMMNVSSLVASKELLEIAIDRKNSVDRILPRLLTANRIHFRGNAGGYCIWSNTSVDLKDAYENAARSLGEITRLSDHIRDRIEVKPIVARKHYITSGTLRYFELKYVDPSAFANAVNEIGDADGLIIVPLCETGIEVEDANRIASGITPDIASTTLIAIPPPLNYLKAFLEEVRRWEWIENSVVELRHDRYAREEVTRQLARAKYRLNEQLDSVVGIRTAALFENLTWYYNGQVLPELQSGRDVLARLTVICDEVFASAPIIHNELINRRVLSSAAAAARLRICERLFEFPSQVLLGMDAAKHPPEMSMYLSVLLKAGFHQQTNDGDGWTVALPEENLDADNSHVLPAMQRIHEVLSLNEDVRVPILRLFEELRRSPYGMRDGIIPLFLAVFAVIHEHELAFYEDGSFIPRINGSRFLRLIKSPETFDIQYYPIRGVRTELFDTIIHTLELGEVADRVPDILDVVRPLLVFISELPESTMKTSHLTERTKAVRSILQTTTDPARLLFHDLPTIFNLLPIVEGTDTDRQSLIDFASGLKSSLDELRAAYQLLIESLSQTLSARLRLDATLELSREAIAMRAAALAGAVTEPRLKSFCLRLSDATLSYVAWLESIGNLLCSMPVRKWRDSDLIKFDQESQKLVSQFLRVEATAFVQIGNGQNAEVVRVALTHPNGEEREQVFHLAPDQILQVQNLENDLNVILERNGQAGMIAASRVLWRLMSEFQET